MPQIPANQDSLKEKFNEMYNHCLFLIFSDVDNKGLIDSQQFMTLCRKNFKSLSMDSLMSYCSSIPNAGASLEDFTLFATSNATIDATTSSSNDNIINNLNLNIKKRSISKVEGATTSSHHSIDLDELEQFILHIGSFYKEKTFSIDKKEEFFSSCSDGILLSLLLNNSIPDTIDERCLNRPSSPPSPPLNLFQMTENNNLVINSAKGIGCSVINIGSEDLIAGKEHLILGLVWQIIKRGLLAKVSLQVHPELFRLLREGESLQDLLALPADAILIRWVNYHLKDEMIITNLSTDIRDSKAYTILLHNLIPSQCFLSPLERDNLEDRAEEMLKGAERIDCRRYVTPSAIVNGNPRLNLAFVANLFNTHPGLDALSKEEEGALIDEGIFSNGDEGDREAKAIALWLNSLNVTPFVQSIYRDLSDGLVLLQAWKFLGKIRTSPSLNLVKISRFQMIENCNASVKLGLDNGFSLVGIQGADICDRSPKLTLSLCWQMMRLHIIDTLSSCSSLEGKSLTDADILTWANEKLSKDSGRISSFKDLSLRDGSLLLKIIDQIRPGIVDWGIYDPSLPLMNAKYIISITRKMGAAIFCLPEDVVELRSKLILSLIAGLMVIDKKK